MELPGTGLTLIAYTAEPDRRAQQQLDFLARLEQPRPGAGRIGWRGPRRMLNRRDPGHLEHATSGRDAGVKCGRGNHPRGGGYADVGRPIDEVAGSGGTPVGFVEAADAIKPQARD